MDSPHTLGAPQPPSVRLTEFERRVLTEAEAHRYGSDFLLRIADALQLGADMADFDGYLGVRRDAVDEVVDRLRHAAPRFAGARRAPVPETPGKALADALRRAEPAFGFALPTPLQNLAADLDNTPHASAAEAAALARRHFASATNLAMAAQYLHRHAATAPSNAVAARLLLDVAALIDAPEGDAP